MDTLTELFKLLAAVMLFMTAVVNYKSSKNADDRLKEKEPKAE